MKLDVLATLTLLSTTGTATAMQVTQVEVDPIALQLPCADSVRDQSGGSCLPASSTPALGHLYPLSSDLFVDPVTGWLGLGKIGPLARLEVEGDAIVNGKLAFTQVTDGITFSSNNPAAEPSVAMLTMFDSGFTNPDRMVVSHSAVSPSSGLAYQDNGDRFVFRSHSTNPTLEIALGSLVFAHEPVLVEVTKTGNALEVTQHGFGSGIQVVHTYSGDAADTADIQRTMPAGAFDNLLHVKTAAGSALNAQLIEARHDTDVEFRVDVDGDAFCDGSFTGGGADFAEMIRVGSGAASVEPGDLLVIDPVNARAVLKSGSARSTMVAGVYSTRPGFVGSRREWEEESLSDQDQPVSLKRADMALRYDEIPMAVVGIVPTKASNEGGPIRQGDLLVSSSTPGHVMRDPDPAVGTVVGKALEPLASGSGRILVLMTLQ